MAPHWERDVGSITSPLIPARPFCFQCLAALPTRRALSRLSTPHSEAMPAGAQHSKTPSSRLAEESLFLSHRIGALSLKRRGLLKQLPTPTSRTFPGPQTFQLSRRRTQQPLPLRLGVHPAGLGPGPPLTPRSVGTQQQQQQQGQPAEEAQHCGGAPPGGTHGARPRRPPPPDRAGSERAVRNCKAQTSLN